MISKTTSSRPSSILGIKDAWVAFQVDSAICTVGLGIENASQEKYNAGSKEQPDWLNKYTMKQLLDPEFRLPEEDSWGLDDEDIKGIEGMGYDEVE